MRKIKLTEYRERGPYRLAISERDSLKAALPSLTIQPAMGAEGAYCLTPASIVGAVEVGDISLMIEPKIGISQLISLACYAIGKVKFQDRDFDVREERALPDALALALSSAARRAFGRGLLHGYLVQEEALQTVRGRIRFNDQIRRRFGIPLPVEVRYDEFTDDIVANRLVKAAVARLGKSGLRPGKARTDLGWVWAMLDNVSLVEFPPKSVPEVKFDRLNEHYRSVVALARLILRHGAFESGRGDVRAQGFLMDMNVVFQEFVTVAFREALGVSEGAFKESEIPSLDVLAVGEKGKISLWPDLVWRVGSACVFVGDAKYKRIMNERIPNADLYQMLAYVTASGLPSGMLIYAKEEGEADGTIYRVRNSGEELKELHVVALDLEGDLDAILCRVGALGSRIRGIVGLA